MENYKDFKILRRGESGWGGLIEHDAGYISPDEPRNQRFINEINKKVMFLEKENSDDNEQAFYNEFGYEPDEQKIEIQNKTIQDIKSERTWASFYNEHKNSGIITIDDDILNDLSKVIYFVNM